VNVRRRELLKASVWITGGAAGVVGAAAEAGSGGPRRCDAAAADHDLASLAAAFDRLSWTLNTGDSTGFLAAFDERAVVIDEDAPFRMSKAGFVEHLGFHGSGMWEGFAWVPRDGRHVVRGDSGFTAGTVTFRGKPVDAGFRLRHMMFTISWRRDTGTWRVVCFHQSPVRGHADGPSPGSGD